MPNWVFNHLDVTGDAADIQAFKDAMNAPYTRKHIATVPDDNGGWTTRVEEVTYSNPVFSFYNIIRPDESILDEYDAIQPKIKSDTPVSDPNWWADTQEIAKTDNSWYNWNIRNWGVKWDVAVSNDNKYPDTYIEGPVANDGTDEKDPWVVYYSFNTAWGVAEEAISALSKQYPKCLLTLSYEEETGWGGQREYLRGHCTYMSEYETQCPDCDKTDCLEYCESCESTYCTKCNYSDNDDECQHAEESEELTNA